MLPLLTQNILRRSILLLMTLSVYTYAGDNIEDVTGGGMVISHKLWNANAFPLTWQLHEDGVVNNDAVGAGTSAISTANATIEIDAAFQRWEDMPLSTITVSSGAETIVGDIGCDLINTVTWSDSVNPFLASSTTIARGVTSSYVGPAIVLTPSNRTLNCGSSVTLPVATYPDGVSLAPGTILDMDMTWNSAAFDYVTTPNTTSSVLDIQAVAAHEFGHMFGFSHTSLAFSSNDPVTMFPTVSASNVTLQNNMRTLEPDDDSSAGRGYPDSGFFPLGGGAFTTGSITGNITDASGTAATGVRVWAYEVSDLVNPVYETFSVTTFDWDAALSPGDYVLDGLAPGGYHICILPWANSVPTATAATASRYNNTTNNGANNTGFSTECFDDIVTTDQPNFAQPDLYRKVVVAAGEETPNIDFQTGVETTDFILVMDRSGSMGGSSGTAGVAKLEALQDSANAFIDFLDISGGHRLGLVQFNANAVPLAPPLDLQSLNATAVANAHTAISAMSSGGWTNIISGIQEGIDQLTSIASPAPRQVMLVFSDGVHNRPVGSDLNDMHDPVVDNDIQMYSIGFGTSVSDLILTDIATDSGGIHVNDQDLDPMALNKHFISIAASATDLTTIIDPRFKLSANDAAILDVPLASDEKELTFYVGWDTRDEELVSVKVITPDGCGISAESNGSGYTVRRGRTYNIVRVPLPYDCNGHPNTEGTWRAVAQTSNSGAEVQMMVYGNSSTRLIINTGMTGRGPLAFAKLTRNGRTLTGARVVGELLTPVPSTNDSERQDELGTKLCSVDANKLDKLCLQVPESIPREKRLTRLQFFDDGTNGDRVASDGTYTAPLKLRGRGSYHLRVLTTAEPLTDQKQSRTLESWTSFYFNNRSIIGR